MRCAARVSFEATDESHVRVFERRFAYRNPPHLTRSDHGDEGSHRAFRDARLYPQDLTKQMLEYSGVRK